MNERKKKQRSGRLGKDFSSSHCARVRFISKPRHLLKEEIELKKKTVCCETKK